MEKQTVQNSKDYQQIIKDWKHDTNYFNGILSVDEMVEMFTNMRFGTGEIQVIMASLMACGAKFKTNDKYKYIISKSFDKSNIDKQLSSGYAYSALEFAKEHIFEGDGDEIYANEEADEAIIKYPEKTYFIFKA